MSEPRLFWEDFPVGEVLEFGSKLVDKHEVIRFAREFDPQPFHLDEEVAARSFFGGLIASGWHTCGMVMRMMWDAYLHDAASLGSPGLDNLRWRVPVRPGDVLRVRRTTLESRVSVSRPDVGIVRFRWEALNQGGEIVLGMDGYQMFSRRPVDGVTA